MPVESVYSSWRVGKLDGKHGSHAWKETGSRAAIKVDIGWSKSGLTWAVEERSEEEAHGMDHMSLVS